MSKEFFGGEGGEVSVWSRDFVKSSMDFLGFDFLPILFALVKFACICIFRFFFKKIFS